MGLYRDNTLGSLQHEPLKRRLLMVLFLIIIFILAIGLLSSQISTINFNRVAIIVLLLSGVLAFHAMWVGQLGSGVGIFNGLFQVTAVTQGIDLFIYIVSALVLLISETQVQKYRLNNEEPASTPGSSNVEVQSIGFPGVLRSEGLPPRTFKILAVPEHPLIILFSVLGMSSSFISSSDFITIFLSIELQSFTVYILATLYRDSQSATFSGLKYFLLGSLSSAI